MSERQYFNGDFRRFKDNPESFAVYLNGVWLSNVYNSEIIFNAQSGQLTYPKEALTTEEMMRDKVNEWQLED